MKTYTIATDLDSGMLLATVRDGQDVIAAAADACGTEIDESRIEVRAGLVLTDELSDGDVHVYSGSAIGCLTDEDGETFEYAVIRKLPPRGAQENTSVTQIRVAVDQTEGQEFIDWLRSQGYEADFTNENAGSVNGVSTFTDQEASAVMNRLWDAYCAF